VRVRVSHSACRGWVFAPTKARISGSEGDRSFEVRIVNTPGLLLKAIQNGVLSVNEADAIKSEFEKPLSRGISDRSKSL